MTITARHRKNWTTDTFLADWLKQSVTKPAGRRVAMTRGYGK